MWETKTFKTAAAQAAWIANNRHKYQITPLFVDQRALNKHLGYAVEYRKLVKPRLPR